MECSDDVSRIEKRLSVSGEEHEEAHDAHVRPGNDSGDCQPHEQVPHEALHGTSHVDHPRPRQPRVAAAGNDGSIEETGEDPGVSADVFEDGDGVEGGLVVGLGGFEDGRVYSEGVGGAVAALNPNTRHGAIHLLDSII